jgi:hypothetical protein
MISANRSKTVVFNKLLLPWCFASCCMCINDHHGNKTSLIESCKQHMALHYCTPPEDGLRTETCSGSNDEEKEDCCISGIIISIKVESYKSQNALTQCYNCQKFGQEKIFFRLSRSTLEEGTRLMQVSLVSVHVAAQHCNARD